MRLARRSDLGAVVGLLRDFYDASPSSQINPFCPDSMMSTVRDMCDSGRLIVAESDGGEIVGTTGYAVGPCPWHLPTLQGIEMFWWVAPNARRSGVGKAMLTKLEDTARAEGVRRWYMVAFADSPTAVGEAYVRAGYREVETSYMKDLG